MIARVLKINRDGFRPHKSGRDRPRDRPRRAYTHHCKPGREGLGFGIDEPMGALQYSSFALSLMQ